MENKEKKVNAAKLEKVNFFGLTFNKEVISNVGRGEEYNLIGHGKKFRIKIIDNEDRNAFLVNICHDGINKSLSFFQKKNDAIHNIFNYINIVVGNNVAVGN